MSMNGSTKKKKIYLDANATTPLDPEVLREIHVSLRDHWANPSSCHQKGLESRKVIEKARSWVACMLEAHPDEIVFTSGGTESNNLAIHSALHHYNLHKHSKSATYNAPPPVNTHQHSTLFPATAQNDGVCDGVGRGEGAERGVEMVSRVEVADNKLGKGEGGEGGEGVSEGERLGEEEKQERREEMSLMAHLPHIITSALEHDSVKLLLTHLHHSRQADVTTVEAIEGGRVQVEEVMAAITPSTCLITLMLANNETGVIQPVKEIGVLLESLNKQRRLNGLPAVLLHSDTAQAIGKVKVSVLELKANYLTVVGHKFYGPRIGALCHREAPIHAMLYGGGQEAGRRPGTENTGLIAGLGKACEMVYLKLDEYAGRMERVRDDLEKKMEEAFAGEVVVHFRGAQRLPNTCNLSFRHPLLKGREVVGRLRVVEAGVGAACHANQTCRASPVLLSSGLPTSLALNAIRLSLGRDTSLDDVQHVIEDFQQAVQSAMSEEAIGGSSRRVDGLLGL